MPIFYTTCDGSFNSACAVAFVSAYVADPITGAHNAASAEYVPPLSVDTCAPNVTRTEYVSLTADGIDAYSAFFVVDPLNTAVVPDVFTVWQTVPSDASNAAVTARDNGLNSVTVTFDSILKSGIVAAYGYRYVVNVCGVLIDSNCESLRRAFRTTGYPVFAVNPVIVNAPPVPSGILRSVNVPPLSIE